MKAQEVWDLPLEDLQERLKGSRRELYELRFKLAVGQLEDNSQVRRVRKDIARLLTVLRQREQSVSAPVAAGTTPEESQS